jgi:hypothetical protein
VTRQRSITQLRKNSDPLHQLPAEGSRLRTLYDRFKAAAGYGIPLIESERNQLEALINLYGCDIRWCGRRQYILAGETLGDGKYIDYVAEQHVKKL